MNFLSAIVGIKYVRWIILANSQRGCFWDYSYWTKQVFPSLDHVTRLAPSYPSVSVHCNQTLRNRDRGIKFGKLKWAAEDGRKWCHNSPGTIGQRDNWLFNDLEVFCPQRSKLIGRRRNDPELYILIEPMVYEGEENYSVFDQAIFLTMRWDIYKCQQVDLDKVIQCLAADVDAAAMYQGSGRQRSLNEFESIVRETFLYRGMLNDPLPDLRKTRGKWIRIFSEKQ